MAKSTPFAEGERQKIRQVARIIFSGGDPKSTPETAELFTHELQLLFTIFTRIIDARYGNYLHFPFEGSLMDQPNKTMIVLDVLREEFRKKIDAEQRRTK